MDVDFFSKLVLKLDKSHTHTGLSVLEALKTSTHAACNATFLTVDIQDIRKYANIHYLGDATPKEESREVLRSLGYLEQNLAGGLLTLDRVEAVK